jgi:hypothetical protein
MTKTWRAKNWKRERDLEETYRADLERKRRLEQIKIKEALEETKDNLDNKQED